MAAENKERLLRQEYDQHGSWEAVQRVAVKG
jgi:hypothetical protein